MGWFTHKSDSESLERARQSRRRAEEELARTRRNTPRIQRLAETLRELREENHFADAIEATFRGERP